MSGLDADLRFSLNLQQTKPSPGPDRWATSCEWIALIELDPTVSMPTSPHSYTWTQEQHLHLFQKSFDQARLQPGALSRQGCVVCKPFQNKALWEAGFSSARCSTHPNPPFIRITLSCLTGTHDGTNWSFWVTGEIPSHASKQVTVSKPMSSRKTGHWHKQLFKFLFCLELKSALLCKIRSKGIKLSPWGNLECPTLDVAGRERQTFCFEK